MNGINVGKVLLGGIAAGIVIDIGEALANLVVFAEAAQQISERMGMAQPGGAEIAILNVLGIAVGIAVVWLYAAIRPRYGPGPGTAVCAGLFAWTFWALFPIITFTVTDVMPVGLAVGFAAWAAVEVTLAAVVGGSLYRENGTAPEPAAAPSSEPAAAPGDGPAV